MAERKDFPNNSDKAKENVVIPERTNTPVAKAKGVRKTSGTKKIKDAIISDSADSVKEYLLLDVLVPSVKKVIKEMVTGGIDMILYGEVRGNRKENERRPAASRVSYRKYYDYEEDDRPSRRSSSSFDIDDILFDRRADAELVLDKMYETLELYRVVSVFDLYEFSDMEPRYTYRNYGWSNLKNARVVPVRGGYIISLPKPMPLD